MTTQLPENRTRQGGSYHRGGRPSKGDRHSLLTRIATPRYDEFVQHVQVRGVSNSDLVEQILVQWLNAHRHELADPGQPQQQMIDLEERRIA